MTPKIVERYLALGLALDRHISGLVDAYYGPKSIAARVVAGPISPPEALVVEARALLAAIDAGEPLGDPDVDWASDHAPLETGGDAGRDATRRHFLRSQTIGLLTTARRLSGEPIGYADEVEACYGVRPRRFMQDEFEAAHRSLEQVVPGSGPLADRYVAWRESQAVPVDLLEPAIASLAEDLRDRTRTMFGLPEGEHVDFALVTGKPWSGFNYYLGGLRSRVEINTISPFWRHRSVISWRTRPIPAITPNAPAKRWASFVATGAGKSRSSSSERPRTWSPRGSPTSGSRW